MRGLTHVPLMGVSWVASENPQPAGTLALSTIRIGGPLPGRSAVVWSLPGNVELQYWGPPLGPLVGPTWSRTQMFSPKNMFVYDFRTYNLCVIQNEHV